MLSFDELPIQTERQNTFSKQKQAFRVLLFKKAQRQRWWASGRLDFGIIFNSLSPAYPPYEKMAFFTQSRKGAML
ncbi:MAG: hypothetical protein DRR16_26460 [Candidatus Parabeggiatoa sp. nov. 3]|nr:MAG: hypothetical protein DRR00_26795 [Gammaproteobacteria bacterium]RKZ57726.1 MAG: hypothetical protein DRQ99_26495 [Gammaproteobacteria bacterium]RKZ79062.1 MAG: hypothetical protein DRR16_26460 [Gammaproteobacteria bacterium]